jgi:hypothetical protein
MHHHHHLLRHQLSPTTNHQPPLTLWPAHLRLAGEVGDDGQLYGSGAEPGWGYLDVKPDEDLYGGLADVFVED